jgi:predicted PurR-regulated permease PerM
MNPRTRLYILIPSLLLLGLFVWYFSAIIIYFLLAAVISFLGRPVMKGLKQIRYRRFQLPNWLCALLSLISVYGVIALLFSILIPVIAQQAQSLSETDPRQVTESFDQPINRLEEWMEKYNVSLPGEVDVQEKNGEKSRVEVRTVVVFVAVDSQKVVPIDQLPGQQLSPSLSRQLAELQGQTSASDSLSGARPPRQKIRTYIQESLIDLVSTVQVSAVFNSVGSFLGNLFVAVFSVSFISFFLLKESQLLMSIILTLSPTGYEKRVEKIISKIKPLLTRYFIGLLLEVLLVGSLIALGLGLLGVENALFIGLFSGIFNVVPYLGPIIGATLGLTLTSLGALDLELTTELLPLLLKVATVFMIVQLIDNIVFQPLIYSSSVKAHPLEIFLVIIMAGSLVGIGGMILAIPVYTIFRVVAQEFLSEFKVIQSITRGI